MQSKQQYINNLSRSLDLHEMNADCYEVFKGAIIDDATGEVLILHILLMPLKLDRYEGEVDYNGNTSEMFWGTKVETYKALIWCPETGAHHYHTSICEALINIQDLELHKLVFN